MKWWIRRFALVLALGYCGLVYAQSTTPRDVRISVPGPGSSVSLPLELAAKLGLDTAQGLKLRLKFVGGGGVAIQDMKFGNADFGLFGLPAAMLAYEKDRQFIALAAVENTAVWVFLVREGLQKKVRKVEDLKGMTIGTHSNSLLAKTTGDVMTRLVLQKSGVPLDAVRVTSAGQNWELQSASLLSNSVDALMTDEPVASRLTGEKLAYPIFSTANPADAKSTPGVGFLRGTLIGRRDKVEADPDTTERVVRMVREALLKMHASSPEKIAEWIDLPEGKPRDAFIAAWKKYPNQYSVDAKFSQRQLRETEAFVRASETDNVAMQSFAVDEMIVDRWSGRKP